jgi:hypothetical protein
MSSQVAKAARLVTHELHGVVVSAGLMQKTVKVRVGGQKWNKVVNKVSLYLFSSQLPTVDLSIDMLWKMGITDNFVSGFLTRNIISCTIPIRH